MSVGGELKSAGLSASLALGLNLWPITHCAQPIRQERTLPLVLWGQFAWRLRRCSEWADAFREEEKKMGQSNAAGARLSHVCGLQVCQQSCQSSDDGEEPNMGAAEQQMASLELKGWEGECTS